MHLGSDGLHRKLRSREKAQSIMFGVFGRMVSPAIGGKRMDTRDRDTDGLLSGGRNRTGPGNAAKRFEPTYWLHIVSYLANCFLVGSVALAVLAPAILCFAPLWIVTAAATSIDVVLRDGNCRKFKRC